MPIRSTRARNIPSGSRTSHHGRVESSALQRPRLADKSFVSAHTSGGDNDRFHRHIELRRTVVGTPSTGAHGGAAMLPPRRSRGGQDLRALDRSWRDLAVNAATYRAKRGIQGCAQDGWKP